MIIASSKLIYTSPDGERNSTEILVEAPIQRETGEYACGVKIPVDENLVEICGEDSFQALNLAIRFIRLRMDGLAEKGFQFYYPEDDKEEFDLDACFGY